MANRRAKAAPHPFSKQETGPTVAFICIAYALVVMLLA
jgi:hypothetical protein